MRFSTFRGLAFAAALSALAIGATGCAQFKQAGDFIQSAASISVSATVSQDAVIVARASFNTAQSLATNYLRLKRCTGSNGPICREPSITVRLGNAVHAGRRARNDLTAFMKAHPGDAVPVASYDAMVAATSLVNDLTAAYSAARGQ